MKKTAYFLFFFVPFLFILTACGGDSSDENDETTPPEVTSMTPAPGATGVSTGIVISVTFSEQLNADTLDSDTFFISASPPLNASVSYDAGTSTATMTPEIPLNSASTYTVFLTTGIEDNAGNNLSELITWTFTTAADSDVTAPLVSEVTPVPGATGVTQSLSEITIIFDEDMDAATIDSDSILLYNEIAAVSGSVTYNPATQATTFMPTGSLDFETDYLLLVTTDVTDQAGNHLASPHISYFTTEAEFYPPIDNTPPMVGTRTPGPDDTDVSIGTSVTVTFSEELDEDSLNDGSFFLTASPPISATVSYDPGTLTATLTPESPLAYASSYTVFLTSGIVDLAGNSLESLVNWSFTTEANPDTTPPQVTDVEPDADATDVSYMLNAVTVAFDEDMDAATINRDSILLYNELAEVAGTVSYNTATMTATFSPDENLDFNSEYLLLVTTGVMDLAGNPLASQNISMFTTEADVYAPTVSNKSPDDGDTDVPLSSVMTVKFNEDMNPTTITSSSVRISGVSGTTTYNEAIRTATFTPASVLPWSTTLTGYVSGSVTDVAGNMLGSTVSWTFVTELDLVPPTVETVTPLNGQTDIDPAIALTASFSEPMDASTLNDTTFTVDNAVTGQVTYNFSNMTATFTPDTWLPSDTTITASLNTDIEDVEGNALDSTYSWSFTTAVDTTAPTVYSVQPINGGRLVSQNATVQITFAEPMDASTISSSTFTVSSTTGSVSYDPSTWTAIFTPSVPFPAGAVRTASVTTGITDMAGNPLAATESFTFTVANASARVSPLTKAEQNDIGVAFTTAGDGMAVWRSTSGGGGGRILAAFFSVSTSTWSSEVELGAYPTGSVAAPVVATDGISFLAAWAKNDGQDETLAAFYSGGSWGTPVQIEAAYEPPTNAVSDGANFAVHSNDIFWVNYAGAWTRTDMSGGSYFQLVASDNGFATAYRTISSYDDYLKARVWLAGSWSSEQTVFSGTEGSVSNNISNISLVSNGTDYATAFSYYYSSIGYSSSLVYASVYSSGSWGNVSLDSGYPGTPVITSDGSGYAVAWASGTPTTPRGVKARIYASGSWGTATYLHTFGYYNYSVKAVSGNSSGYVVTWNGEYQFNASVYESSSWGTAVVLDTDSAIDVVVASNGSTHNVIWTQDGDDAVKYSVYGSSVWSGGVLQAAGSGESDNLILTRHSTLDYQVLWAQTGDVNNRRLSGSWQSRVNLVQGTYYGHASDAQLVSNSTGDALAVWEQYDMGSKGIWARPFSGGSWGIAFEVSSTGSDPDVAVSDDHAVVIWRDGSANNYVYTRRYTFTSETWASTQALQEDAGTVWPPAIASDGSGFMAVYPSSFSLRYRTSADGNFWDDELTASGGGKDPDLSTNGSSYLLLMGSTTYGSSSFYGRVFASGTWTSNYTVGTLASSYSSIWDMVPYAGGYVVAWEATGSDVNARVYNGTSWETTESLNSNYSSSSPSLASDGTSAFCYFNDSDYVSRRYAAGNWEDSILVPFGGEGSLAVSSSDLATLIVRSDGAGTSVSSNSYADGVWGHAGGFIESGTGAASNPLLVKTGTDFLGVWEQDNSTQNNGEIWSSIGN
ncbi:MAG: Ig-like domain-containing protein [Gammaproteobacteria bacterium]|nr:Ig-like domain-containing protein [Gammaproteobacteria bacterium]